MPQGTRRIKSYIKCNCGVEVAVTYIKMIMKKIVLFAILSGTLFLSCKKEKTNSAMVTGIITGFDYGMCPCCGGLFIAIGDSTYRIESLSVSSGINVQNDSFPINIELTYTIDSTRCTGLYILSNDIRRR